jgi:hypothetical protein
MALERESLSIVAWDDAHHLYRIDFQGRPTAEHRLEEDIRTVAVSDTGEHTFVFAPGPSLLILAQDGSQRARLAIPFEPTALAVDPFGDYIALASSDAQLVVMNRRGKTLGRTVAPQSYKHLAFVPASGQIVAAAEQGVVAGHNIKGNLLWKETMYSTIGGMAVDHAGQTVALAAFGYGITRFNADGKREGTYQIGRSPHLVAVDFDGSKLVASSVDGYVIALNYDGHMLGEKALAERAQSLAIDPLGRFVVLGFPSGEIRFFDWNHLGQTPTETSTDANTLAERPSSTPPAPNAAWTLTIVGTEDEARSTVLQPLADSDLVAISTPRRTIRIIDRQGQEIHESVRLEGTGRILTASPGGLFAATDRRLLHYSVDTRSSSLLPIDAFDISHLLALPTPGEAILVESCDTVSRIALPGQVVWKERLPVRTAGIAVDRESRIALVMEDHQLLILNDQGKKQGRFRATRPMPLLVASLPNGWVTASIGEQTLRYHDPDGRARSSIPLPWDPWTLLTFDSSVVITRADGQSLLVDSADGGIQSNNQPREGAIYFAISSPEKTTVCRAFTANPSFAVTDFAGKLLCKHRSLETIHSLTAGPAAVWVLAGRSLSMYPLPPT